MMVARKGFRKSCFTQNSASISYSKDDINFENDRKVHKKKVWAIMRSDTSAAMGANQPAKHIGERGYKLHD